MKDVSAADADDIDGGGWAGTSRLPCYVFCICLLTNKNSNANKLSWALGRPRINQKACLVGPSDQTNNQSLHNTTE